MAPNTDEPTIMMLELTDSERLDWSQGAVRSMSFAPQYHPIWCSILRDLGEDCRALLAQDDDRVVGWLFYTVKETDCGAVVNSVPFLPYGGPIARSAGVEVALLDELRLRAEQVKADVLSLATHPLMSTEAEDRWRQALVTTHVHENFVQLQTLNCHPLEAMKSRSRTGFRRKIRRAVQAGLRVRQADTLADVEQWLDIYRTRFDDIGATAYPDDFFRHTFERAVPAGVAELWLAELGKTTVGGVWLLVGGRCADYFASAFDFASNDQYPATLVMHEIFTSLVCRGVPVLNWQSSPGRGGVYEFKRRWGAHEHRHLYCSVLLNEASGILSQAPESLRARYPFRFVMPYSALAHSSMACTHT